MKKITTELGTSHSQFEHQTKDLLNEMADAMDDWKKWYLANHPCSTCDSCPKPATIIITNVIKNTFENYCNDCLK
jgi:hypothetical protein